MELITESEITCPYCGEAFAVQIDTSQPEQTTIEDCSICCHPIMLSIRCRFGVVLELNSSSD
jgi:hypothetical protein